MGKIQTITTKVCPISLNTPNAPYHMTPHKHLLRAGTHGLVTLGLKCKDTIVVEASLLVDLTVPNS